MPDTTDPRYAEYTAYLAAHAADNPEGDTLSFGDWLAGEEWLTQTPEPA